MFSGFQCLGSDITPDKDFLDYIEKLKYLKSSGATNFLFGSYIDTLSYINKKNNLDIKSALDIDMYRDEICDLIETGYEKLFDLITEKFRKKSSYDPNNPIVFGNYVPAFRNAFPQSVFDEIANVVPMSGYTVDIVNFPEGIEYFDE